MSDAKLWSLITRGCYAEGHSIMVNKPERAHLGAGAPETVCEMNSSLCPEVTKANQTLFCEAAELYCALSALIDSHETEDEEWKSASWHRAKQVMAKLDNEEAAHA